MPSTIHVSRRIYLSVLIVALLLALLLIGSSWVRAQGLCEYGVFFTVCLRPGGLMRVVESPDDCWPREVPGFLVNAEKLECILGPLASNFQEALDTEKEARIAGDEALELRIEALEELHAP